MVKFFSHKPVIVPAGPDFFAEFVSRLPESARDIYQEAFQKAVRLQQTPRFHGYPLVYAQRQPRLSPLLKTRQR